jgi:uncharacterized membrane protein YgaE (UPF0421/DUF939 family)
MRKSVRNHLARESIKPLNTLFIGEDEDNDQSANEILRLKNEKQIFKDVFFDNDFKTLEAQSRVMMNGLNETKELLNALSNLQDEINQKLNNFINPHP